MFHRNAPNIHISILAKMTIFPDPFDTRCLIKDPFVLFTELGQRDEAICIPWFLGLRVEDFYQIMYISATEMFSSEIVINEVSGIIELEEEGATVALLRNDQQLDGVRQFYIYPRTSSVNPDIFVCNCLECKSNT